MAFGVLHLSDMHFRENETEIKERASAVRAGVQSRCTVLSSIIVVFSGDLAYSGKQSQYNIVSAFIDHLMGQLRTIPGVEVMGPVIVPGNHDCDFATEGRRSTTASRCAVEQVRRFRSRRPNQEQPGQLLLPHFQLSHTQELPDLVVSVFHQRICHSMFPALSVAKKVFVVSPR